METLDTLFKSFEMGIRMPKAVKPKEYLKNLGLDYTDLRIGFNSGQLHHNVSQELKDNYEALGVIQKSTAGVSKEGMTAYSVFGRYSVVFPLINQKNEVVNLFAIRFELANQQAEYLNKEGIYPAYPPPLTRRLYIVPTVLDCASLMQSKILENRDSVMSLHNAELLPQHLEAIKTLHELEEIIIIKN